MEFTVDQQALLAYVKQSHDHYKVQLEVFGGPYTAAVMDLIVIGYLQSAPYKREDLSSQLKIPMAALQDILKELHDLELIRVECRHGNQYIHASQKLMKFVFRASTALAAKQAQGWHKVSALFIKTGCWTSIAAPIGKLVSRH